MIFAIALSEPVVGQDVDRVFLGWVLPGLAMILTDADASDLQALHHPLRDARVLGASFLGGSSHLFTWLVA